MLISSRGFKAIPGCPFSSRRDLHLQERGACALFEVRPFQRWLDIGLGIETLAGFDLLMDTHDATARATYRFDRIKAPFYGVLEAGWMSFSLVVAIRYFEAPEAVKAFIAGAGPIGFLLSPVVLFAVACLRARPSTACGGIFLASALCLGGTTFSSSLAVFAALAIASQTVAVQQSTLMLHIYAANYPPHERGSRITMPLILTSLAAILFALLGGWILDRDIAYYRIVYAIMACAALAAAAAVSRIPAAPLSTQHVGNPWQNLSLIWKDRFFGYLLGSWMLLGLGNLVTMPIRVEYLANPAFGIDADNTTIAFLLLVVPSTTRILSTRMWGRIFDRFHFITTRNCLNVFFLLGIGLFFFSSHIALLTLAMAFVGIAMGGGKIMWNLWVTKIAPAEKASSYMSVHMAMTGLRGTLAPFIGYWILSRSSPQAVAIFGLLLVGGAIVLFEGVRQSPRFATRAGGSGSSCAEQNPRT